MCTLTPPLLILGLVLLSVIPVKRPLYIEASPMLTIIGVVYWSIVRPDLIRPSFAFATGVFEDLLSGTPLGLNALVLLCVHAAVSVYKRLCMSMPFFFWWCIFALIALVAILLKWFLFSLLADTINRLGDILFSYCITVLIYPVFGRLFASLEVLLAKEE
ncbi:Rod shape-determining protein MreD [invertebrate metagenome]|uniref:Rod shape-determining protein MreD n=1 Tax=invertebrate metagenome TaxID=1711999 RepID=A0A484HBD4_9ZZZZ